MKKAMLGRKTKKNSSRRVPYLEVGALGEDGLKGAFALRPKVVTAVVVNHARLRWEGWVKRIHGT